MLHKLQIFYNSYLWLSPTLRNPRKIPSLIIVNYEPSLYNNSKARCYNIKDLRYKKT